MSSEIGKRRRPAPVKATAANRQKGAHSAAKELLKRFESLSSDDLRTVLDGGLTIWEDRGHDLRILGIEAL